MRTRVSEIVMNSQTVNLLVGFSLATTSFESRNTTIMLMWQLMLHSPRINALLPKDFSVLGSTNCATMIQRKPRKSTSSWKANRKRLGIKTSLKSASTNLLCCNPKRTIWRVTSSWERCW